MIKTVLFDLDGTLINMDQEAFIKAYFGSIEEYCTKAGFDGKLVLKGVGAATMKMVANDGSTTNEELFWQVFSATTNISKEAIEGVFIKYYDDMFDAVIECSCKRNEQAIELVRELSKKGINIIISTNPLFPQIATFKRLRFGGFEPESFELVTTYENSSYAKPNLAYYREIMQQFNLSSDECMMFGNDVKEDYCIKELGVKIYLLADDLINSHNLPYDKADVVSYNQALELVKKL